MKLDNENDRKILLELIARSQIAGSAAPMIANLMQRIDGAEIDLKEEQKDAKNQAS